jgi:hypothetical protein
MPSSTLRHGSFSWGPRLASLWFGIVAGPLAWAALLQTNYVLSYVACEQRHTWMLHLSAAVALALIAAGAYASWTAAPLGGAEDEASPDPADAAVNRARFMAISGLALCAWFSLVILATEIPVLVLQPCAW